MIGGCQRGVRVLLKGVRGVLEGVLEVLAGVGGCL